jgi:uncharacterized protein (TIGR02246 family)
MSDDEKAIRRLIETWMRATKEGDLSIVLSLMSDDVIFMVPGREPFGKEEFAASFQQLKNVRIDTESNIQEVKVLGDWAYLRNRLSVTMVPLQGGRKVRRRGYTLSVMNKTPAGNWVLVRDANLLSDA